MRTRIKSGSVGLVYRNEEFYNVLQSGVYYLNPFTDHVQIVATGVRFIPKDNLNRLLRITSFKNAIHLVEVKQGEICIVFKDGLYSESLFAGRYIYFKGDSEFEFKTMDFESSAMITDEAVLKLVDNHLATYVRKLEVESYEESVLLINGEFNRMLPAGSYYFFKNSKRIAIKKVDTRLMAMEVSGQEMLTRDKANLRVNFNLQYKVTDVRKAVLENNDFEKQLYLSAQLLLREVIGANTLDEILENKEVITNHVMEAIANRAAMLGVTVIAAGVKDIILPGDMKDIMNQVLVAQKRAQANVITRREEVASTRSLLNTAKMLEENSMLYRLKEMEYLERISERIGEVTVSGNTDMLKQLQTIFGSVTDR